jgi:hypothetical protein
MISQLATIAILQQNYEQALSVLYIYIEFLWQAPSQPRLLEGPEHNRVETGGCRHTTDDLTVCLLTP